MPLRYALGLLAVWAALDPVPMRAQAVPPPDALLEQVRAASRQVNGSRPESVRYLTFAAATATASEVLEGGGADSVDVAFAVFQIRYGDRWIVVDAGMDQAALEEFNGRPDPFPYWPERYARVRRALRGAAIIVVTHEHYDHAIGIERGPDLDEITPHVVLSAVQLKALRSAPAIRYSLPLPADLSGAFRTVDVDRVYPLAPGVALIAAPGHTPGSLMVYVHPASGPELLLIGDVVWNLDGVAARRQRPGAVSTDLGEDREALEREIDWLHTIMTRYGVLVIPAHDGSWLAQLTRDGLLADDLELDAR